MIEGTVFAPKVEGGFECIGVLPEMPRPSDQLKFRAGSKVYLLDEAEYRELDREANDQSYQVGYDEGYTAGQEDSDDGTEAYQEGLDEGHAEGYQKGLRDAAESQGHCQ